MLIELSVIIFLISSSVLILNYNRYISVVVSEAKTVEEVIEDDEEEVFTYDKGSEEEVYGKVDKEYDERIARFKEELIAVNFPGSTEYEMSVADEIHPGVKNIPHEEVDATYGEDGGEEVSV